MISEKRARIQRFNQCLANWRNKEHSAWIHRYLRLHGELLEDPVYKMMFEFYRAKQISYLKKNAKRKNKNDAQLGELVDVLADIFNRYSPDRVNAYKWEVESLYRIWKKIYDQKKQYQQTAP